MWLMRGSAAFLLCVCLLSLRAQTPDDPEVLQARAQLEKLRVQAAAGAVPRKQLEKAEEQMAMRRMPRFSARRSTPRTSPRSRRTK
jgi:hypothetical protein